ncbi:hypothetical protein [Labilithrix luteola]|uniref:hypothetical protein n=1 Tax=Labilithrix luteola TaxID=1391654 RepID=UPI0011BAC940|nr:hypothetical protein [Labilithrix luteola]
MKHSSELAEPRSDKSGVRQHNENLEERAVLVVPNLVTRLTACMSSHAEGVRLAGVGRFSVRERRVSWKTEEALLDLLNGEPNAVVEPSDDAELDAFAEAIRTAFMYVDVVEISSFGTLSAKEKPDYETRELRTIVVFRADIELVNSLRG